MNYAMGNNDSSDSADGIKQSDFTLVDYAATNQAGNEKEGWGDDADENPGWGEADAGEASKNIAADESKWTTSNYFLSKLGFSVGNYFSGEKNMYTKRSK